MSKIELQEMESIQKIRRITADKVREIHRANNLYNNSEKVNNSILPEICALIGIGIFYILFL